MNAKRILIAIIVSFVLFTGTDFLLREVCLKSVYAQDAGRLWKQPSLVGLALFLVHQPSKPAPEITGK